METKQRQRKPWRHLLLGLKRPTLRGVRQKQTADLQTCDKLLLDARIRKHLMLIFLLESPRQTLSHAQFIRVAIQDCHHLL